MVRYIRKDVIAGLKRIQPYDWDGFIQARFYAPPKGLPSGGMEAIVRRCVGDPHHVNCRLPAHLRSHHYRDGPNWGVVPGSLAECAVLEDGMTLLRVDGFLITLPRLQEAVRD